MRAKAVADRRLMTSPRLTDTWSQQVAAANFNTTNAHAPFRMHFKLFYSPVYNVCLPHHNLFVHTAQRSAPVGRQRQRQRARGRCATRYVSSLSTATVHFAAHL